MTIHPNAHLWKRVLWILRSLVFFVFALDLAIWLGLLPLPEQSVSKWAYLPWFLYRLSFYLLFEFLWRHYALWHARLIHLFVLILALLLGGIVFDLTGNSLNLFATLWWYDRLIHFTVLPWGLSALFLLFSRIFAEKHHLTHLFWFVPYGILSGLALATIAHEIIEYLIDLITQSNVGTMSLDVYDTVRDISLNMLGGLVFIALYLLCRKAIIPPPFKRYM